MLIIIILKAFVHFFTLYLFGKQQITLILNPALKAWIYVIHDFKTKI